MSKRENDNYDQFYILLVEEVRALLKYSDASQKEICGELGMEYKTFNKILNLKQRPTARIMVKICAYFKIDMKRLASFL